MATATPRLRHEGFLLISDPHNNALRGDTGLVAWLEFSMSF